MSDELPDAHNAATESGEKTSRASDEEHRSRAFLDALALRSRGEFDTSLAKSMHSVLDQAIRMVEAGTVEADKASPGGVSALPDYADQILRNARVHRYRTQDLDWIPAAAKSVEFDKNLVRVTVPAELAHYQLASQALDQQQPPRSFEHSRPEDRDQRESELSPARIFIGGGIPIAVTAVGALLTVASALTQPTKPNPYVAIAILILGVGLILTAVIALRERRQEL